MPNSNTRHQIIKKTHKNRARCHGPSQKKYVKFYCWYKPRWVVILWPNTRDAYVCFG